MQLVICFYNFFYMLLLLFPVLFIMVFCFAKFYQSTFALSTASQCRCNIECVPQLQLLCVINKRANLFTHNYAGKSLIVPRRCATFHAQLCGRKIQQVAEECRSSVTFDKSPVVCFTCLH